MWFNLTVSFLFRKLLNIFCFYLKIVSIYTINIRTNCCRLYFCVGIYNRNQNSYFHLVLFLIQLSAIFIFSNYIFVILSDSFWFSSKRKKTTKIGQTKILNFVFFLFTQKWSSFISLIFSVSEMSPNQFKSNYYRYNCFW